MTASGSFDFDAVDVFTVGTLGPKGERVFYVQSWAEGQLVSLRLEKQQVAALAEYLGRVLDELPDAEDEGDYPSDLDLREPVIAAWTVGSLGVAYRGHDDRLIVLAEELVDEDDETIEPESARFALTRAQVLALIERARRIVASGREPCPYCGQPLDPANESWCPCSN